MSKRYAVLGAVALAAVSAQTAKAETADLNVCVPTSADLIAALTTPNTVLNSTAPTTPYGNGINLSVGGHSLSLSPEIATLLAAAADKDRSSGMLSSEQCAQRAITADAARRGVANFKLAPQ